MEKGQNSPCTISIWMLTQIVVMKVHWFHMSVLKSRWEEENALIIKEMKRCTRFFKYSHHDWLLWGDTHKCEGQHGYAVYTRKCICFMCLWDHDWLTVPSRQVHRFERLIESCSKKFTVCNAFNVVHALFQVSYHHVYVVQDNILHWMWKGDDDQEYTFDWDKHCYVPLIGDVDWFI